jgi:predicted RNA binding protein YcfA (HicA-like mRNA interferase family)
MGKHEKLRERICSGTCDANLPFVELCSMLEHFGFVRQKRSGTSHRIYARDGVREIINIQPDGNGKAKRYQVKQVRAILEHYKIP